MFPFLAQQIKALESSRDSCFSLQKEVVSFKGNDEYYDNFPFSVAFEKEFSKTVRKIISKIKFVN